MRQALHYFAAGLGVIVVLFILGIGLPWANISWGRIIFDSPRTITVTGSAQREEANQLASFSAGVEAANLDKQAALTAVQQQMEKLVADLKAANIPQADIKTSNVSVWQSQDPVPMDNGRTSTKPGEWRVNNTIEVIVRDVKMTEKVLQILNSSGATNVYGPNYRADETQKGNDLLAKAVEDARAKADAVAAAQNVSVVRVLSITEGSAAGGVFPMALKDGAGGGGPVLPGTSTISTSATVVFEVK